MAKKAAKPNKRIELEHGWGEWTVQLHIAKGRYHRRATANWPQRLCNTYRVAMRTAKAWSEATGWPIVED